MSKLRNKILISSIVVILMAIHLTWDYFNGGVTVHYILANEDLPGISNWWGLLTVPSLTWISLSLMFNKTDANSKERFSKVIFAFLLSKL
jgi:hypothetical protein